MEISWYPQKKGELIDLIKKFSEDNEKDVNYQRLKSKLKNKKIHGVIVPHAGYFFSGKISLKAISLLKESLADNLKEYKKNEMSIKNQKNLIVLGTNHYNFLEGIYSTNSNFLETPLGKIEVIENDFPKTDIFKEHSINNQIPLIQFLGFKRILPLVIGDISLQSAKILAEKLSKMDFSFIFSSDLSHFLEYEQAIKRDKETIKAIKNLDEKYFLNKDNVACGFFPLLVLINLCKIKKWKPVLLEYKNSGDITNQKDEVVGYASFIF